MGSRNAGSTAWTAALPLLVSALVLCPPPAPAASASTNLSVSVNVPRSCGISLDQTRTARPRPLCQSGTIAPALARWNDRGLQYSGRLDPVSIVRQPGKGGAPDIWRVTF